MKTKLTTSFDRITLSFEGTTLRWNRNSQTVTTTDRTVTRPILKRILYLCFPKCTYVTMDWVNTIKGVAELSANVVEFEQYMALTFVVEVP